MKKLIGIIGMLVSITYVGIFMYYLNTLYNPVYSIFDIQKVIETSYIRTELIATSLILVAYSILIFSFMYSISFYKEFSIKIKIIWVFYFGLFCLYLFYKIPPTTYSAECVSFLIIIPRGVSCQLYSFIDEFISGNILDILFFFVSAFFLFSIYSDRKYNYKKWIYYAIGIISTLIIIILSFYLSGFIGVFYKLLYSIIVFLVIYMPFVIFFFSHLLIPSSIVIISYFCYYIFFEG